MADPCRDRRTMRRYHDGGMGVDSAREIESVSVRSFVPHRRSGFPRFHGKRETETMTDILSLLAYLVYGESEIEIKEEENNGGNE